LAAILNLSEKVNQITIRIYYEDTDFSGIVYHASYLRFMERGRTELLRDIGIHHSELLKAEGGPFAFAVRHMDLNFLKSAKIDDLLLVKTSLKQVKGASMLLNQQIIKQASREEVITTAEVKIAFLGANGRASRLPATLIEKFKF